jgi:hypothetical protein
VHKVKHASRQSASVPWVPEEEVRGAGAKAARPHDPDWVFTPVRFKSLTPHPLPWLAAHGPLCNKTGAHTFMKRYSKLMASKRRRKRDWL